MEYASDQLPDPGPGCKWRRLSPGEATEEGDIHLHEESQMWHETLSVGDVVWRGHYVRRVFIDQPDRPSMVFPASDCLTPKQGRYAEVKRLAEMAFANLAALQINMEWETRAAAAWVAAEAMHAESEKRKAVHSTGASDAIV